MTKLRASLLVLVLWLSVVAGRAAATAAKPLELDITSQGDFVGVTTNGQFFATNHVVVQLLTSVPSSNVVLTADYVTGDTNTGDVDARGNVRVQETNITWIGGQLHFNYYSRQMDFGEFRAGKSPFFLAGESVQGNETNNLYTGKKVFVTTDDYSKPLETVHASQITIVPGKYVEARNAVVYIGNIPVFYFPYYRHDLSHNPNHFTFLAGDRSVFGPYLLSTYEYTVNDQLSGAVHADWRERRGFGTGPDFSLNLGQYGVATVNYYYTHDNNPGLDQVTNNTVIPQNRQRAYFTYQGTPLTNLTIMSQAAYLSDPFVTHDFFESEYQKDIQPNTFADADKVWPNWSLDGLAQTQVDRFYESVERLPDVRLTGFRQEVFDTPLYYESQTSAGYYRRAFSDTNQAESDYESARADTFHQLTLPETFFGWLNFTPRVGGRFTYYGPEEGPGATTTNQDRYVLNTGAELSFKLSQTWPGIKNDFFELDGLRHIIEPSINYAYVPRPNVQPQDLPQYDYELSNSLELLPLDFPDYNAIDSIDAMNTVRFGLDNRLQTKRNGDIVDFLNWDVYTDWRLRHDAGVTTFSDVYSELQARPWSWLTLASLTRYDIASGRFNMAQDSITFQPNTTWSLTLGQFFLRDDPVFGPGDDLFSTIFFYRLNENWGARIQESFDAKTGTWEEQDYTLYRDLRSWTAAVTFRALDNVTTGHDYGVAVTFSFKAFPHYALGEDTVTAAPLLGY